MEGKQRRVRRRKEDREKGVWKERLRGSGGSRRAVEREWKREKLRGNRGRGRVVERERRKEWSRGSGGRGSVVEGERREEWLRGSGAGGRVVEKEGKGNVDPRGGAANLCSTTGEGHHERSHSRRYRAAQAVRVAVPATQPHPSGQPGWSVRAGASPFLYIYCVGQFEKG